MTWRFRSAPERCDNLLRSPQLSRLEAFVEPPPRTSLARHPPRGSAGVPSAALRWRRRPLLSALRAVYDFSRLPISEPQQFWIPSASGDPHDARSLLFHASRS